MLPICRESVCWSPGPRVGGGKSSVLGKTSLLADRKARRWGRSGMQSLEDSRDTPPGSFWIRYVLTSPGEGPVLNTRIWLWSCPMTRKLPGGHSSRRAFAPWASSSGICHTPHVLCSRRRGSGVPKTPKWVSPAPFACDGISLSRSVGPAEALSSGWPILRMQVASEPWSGLWQGGR